MITAQMISDMTAFINAMIVDDIEMSLKDFTLKLHGQFYPHMNISFMEEFLKLADYEKEGQFIIPHKMLAKYGVVASDRNDAIKRRLDRLEFVEGQNYLIHHKVQQVKSGAKHSNIYMLTPESFFLALMRSKRTKGQDVDPMIYAEYFQFIQKAFLQYTKYQLRCAQHKAEILSGENKSLNTDNKSLKESVQELLSDNKELKSSVQDLLSDNDLLKANNNELLSNVQELLTHSTNAEHKLDVMNHKLDFIIKLLVDTARMSFPAYIGSSVFRERIGDLTGPNVKNLKLVFAVGLTDGERLLVLFCCRAIKNIHVRIREISEDRNIKYHMNTMFQPLVVGLMNEDIQREFGILKKTQIRYISKFKALSQRIEDDAYTEYINIVNIVRSLREQSYRKAIANMRERHEASPSAEMIVRIQSRDDLFYQNTDNVSQTYLNTMISKNSINCQFTGINRVVSANMVNRLTGLIQHDDVSELITEMVHDGIFTKDSRPIVEEMAEAQGIHM